MNMIHRFMGCIREYKKPTILTLLCVVGEVAIEVLIPFFTANLVNEIKGGAELSGVVRVGLGLILMSLVSLGCGALGGLYGSRASAGFAKNVRHDVFTRVQSFAFENIDQILLRLARHAHDDRYQQCADVLYDVHPHRGTRTADVPLRRHQCLYHGRRAGDDIPHYIPVLVIGLLLIARKAMPACPRGVPQVR